jgi:D-apionolactonase
MVPLRAGPLTLLFDEDSLRYIRLGDREIVRRIYCAVRDRNWGTVPNQVQTHRQQVRDDSFILEFEVHNLQEEIDFRWNARITGDAEGLITFEIHGCAHSTFWKNRIGFCVLHPIEGCAGEACCIVQDDGTQMDSAFPRFIAPENPFQDITAIRHNVADGIWADLAFEGDVFEMEDQRNWTDASFKTFCTPLRRPFPVQINRGDKVFQRVTVQIKSEPRDEGDDRSRRVSSPGGFPSSALNEDTVALTIAGHDVCRLPQIGLCWTPHEQPWTAQEKERLGELALSHLRLELQLNNPRFASELSLAVADAGSIGVPLEVALFVSDDAEHELRTLIDWLRKSRPRIVRWLVFHRDRWSTPRDTVEMARNHLRSYDPQISIGAGSSANFAELNRGRPPVGLLDFATYSLHPQTHSFDNASLVETLAAQADTVASARQFLGDCPIAVGPVTLKQRVNPYATDLSANRIAGQLPPRVDRRQMSLLGAAWTLGSLKYLAESQVAAVTYYETVGWLGVMEYESGAPLPDQFPSVPGCVFPLYFVLADLGAVREAAVVPVRSSDALRVVGMALRVNEKMRMMIANLSGSPQRVTFDTNANIASLRILDEGNALEAIRSPETFRRETSERHLSGNVKLNLLPYAYVFLDLR